MRMRPNKHGFDVFIIIDNLKPNPSFYLLVVQIQMNWDDSQCEP
jgi:hypothetical protein